MEYGLVLGKMGMFYGIWVGFRKDGEVLGKMGMFYGIWVGFRKDGEVLWNLGIRQYNTII